ncbi:KpsF/GutQ family sugar-phosphate isomerase [Amylibacter sp.]|nr:KpsF/GutQ family sugar-phosphate isomerase [Amylibacter sp.]
MTIKSTFEDCLLTGTNAMVMLTDSLKDEKFVKQVEAAVNVICKTSGRLVISGMGKSGIIGKKLVATFASTGTPSLFLHPAEASHGDLGMLCKDDVLLLMSFSGESRELIDIIRYSKRFNVPIIAFTANANSTLGKAADILLQLPKVKESCPHNLAPTSSTLIQLALGDALAITLLKEKGFSEEDFFNFHPGGKLGAALMPIKDLMHTDDKLPLISQDAPFSDILNIISSKGYGIVGLKNDIGEMSGVITDGDVRRYITKNTDGSMKEVMFETFGKEIMTKSFVSFEENQSCAKILSVLEQKNISSAFVLKNGKPLGLISMLMLIQAGVA